MDHVFSMEQEDLRSAVRGVLELEAPEVKVRDAMESDLGYDVALWKRLAGELGLQGIIVPEEHGGAGAGLVELGVVFEELGRALYTGPFLSTALATLTVLDLADEEFAAECLPRISSGELLMTLACDELIAPDSPGEPLVVGVQGEVTTLTGSMQFVLDAHIAEVIVVAAEGDGLYAIDRDASGLEVEQLRTLDMTRRLARVTFTDAPARRIGPDVSADALGRIRDRAVAVLAAEQVGAAQLMLDTAVEYAKVRTQFGRTIGSFQAIKHKCADLMIELDAARSAAYDTIWASTDDGPELVEVSAAIAHSYCSEAFVHVAAGAIQILGGIGFTWEHPAHLYYRRAKGSQLTFGSPGWHRRRLVDLLGLAPA